MIQYIQISSLSTDGRCMVSCELVLVVWRGVVPNWFFFPTEVAGFVVLNIILLFRQDGPFF